MKPRYSKNRVRAAGEALVKQDCPEEERREAREVLAYWRAAHDYPMREMADVLAQAARDFPDAVIASRLKRTDTIIGKLGRLNCTYKLNTMQDIAGCRIILKSQEDAYAVVNSLRSSDSCHRVTDHVASPECSGYRSIHTIHRFDSPDYGYTGLSVEAQIRTILQHAWATAVETYDILNNEMLKFDAGNIGCKRFFLLASRYLSCLEAGTIGASEIGMFPDYKELSALNKQLGVLDSFRAYSQSVTVLPEKELDPEGYCLLKVDFDNAYVEIEVYSKTEASNASEKYDALELTKKTGMDYLLLRASSIEQIKKAYPNYCSDISVFIDAMASL